MTTRRTEDSLDGNYRFQHPRLGRAIAAAAATAFVALAAVSCTTPQDRTDPATVSTAPIAPAPASHAATPPASQPIGQHWIQDQRLRAVMAQLSQHNPTWPAGLPQEPESPVAATQPQQFDEIADLAHSLASTAEGLPRVSQSLVMSEADRAGFLAEARTLRDQAAALQAAANRRSIEQMQRQMDGINATCISCHSRYRDFTGLLRPPQALLQTGAGAGDHVQ